MSKALKVAIEANDPEAVRQALKGIKDVNRKIPGANKPLLYACEKGADKVLEVLFEVGAVAERRSTFPGDTPFAIAAQHGHAKVLERLWILKQVSQHALDHALSNSTIEGRESSLEILLQIAKPPITIELFRLAAASNRAPQILKLLVKYGGDVHSRQNTWTGRGMMPLHDRVGTGNIDVIQTLIECGADVNAEDGLGRTPLMILAGKSENIEHGNELAISRQALESGDAATKSPKLVSCTKAILALLELGADATLVDNSGNDAIDHCKFGYFWNKKKADPNIIAILRKAGAKGSEPTLQLFDAIQKKDIQAFQAVIKQGADVNRLAPLEHSLTPLTYAARMSLPESIELVRVLLEAGAEPNKYGGNWTPLINAAKWGNLPVVKKLVAVGADIHALELNDEFPDNAYSFVQYDKPEIADYLKSLGASKPKPTKSELLKPGVESWNDFSELLVKSTVAKAAEALASIIKGKVQLDVYGQSMLPGKQAYVVARPKGMNWCNIFQISPPRLRYEDSSKAEALARQLAKVSGAFVLSIEYSDTSDAASIFRAEPDGESLEDAGWDRDTLEEMVGAMGDEAPEWAKQQLAKSDEDEPSSTERLEMLAAQEKFVVAAFDLDYEPGRKLDVDFTGYGAEFFEGVAFVSD